MTLCKHGRADHRFVWRLSKPIEIISVPDLDRDDTFVTRGLGLGVGAQHDGHVGAVDVGRREGDFMS